MTAPSDFTFALYDQMGNPLTGVVPTWAWFGDAIGSVVDTPPAISEVGGGAYSTPLKATVGKHYVGIIDAGPLALQRYLFYDSPGEDTTILTFALFGVLGAPLAGLTATWLSFKEAITNVPATPPALAEVGNGIYSFPMLSVPNQRYIGTADFGPSASPRYVLYDSPYVVPVTPKPSTTGAVAANYGATSLVDARLQVRERADMVNSEFVTDAEISRYISLSYSELYDLLVQKYGDDYFVADPYTFATDGVNYQFDLPVDFFKLLGVDLQVAASPNGWITLKPFNRAGRNRFVYPNVQATLGTLSNLQYRINGNKLWLMPLPAGAQTLRLWYVPCPPVLQESATITFGNLVEGDYISVNNTIFTAVSGLPVGAQFQISSPTNTAANFVAVFNAVFSPLMVAANTGAVVTVTPSVSGCAVKWSSSTPRMLLSQLLAWSNLLTVAGGWIEYVIIDAAIKCLQKEESDVGVLMAQKGAMIQRINNAAENRDAGMPSTVADVSRQGGNGWNWGSGDGGGFW